jgi:hypothetical protein
MTLSEDVLFVELVKVVDDWLWRNGMIDNRPGLRLDCFDRLMGWPWCEL